MSFERRKVRVGRVVSDKMDKTVIVSVEWRRPHRLYRKAVRRRTRFQVHDEDNRCTTGDLVRITETRPLSKLKRWKVAEILVHEDIAEVQPEDIKVDEPGILVAERRGPQEREADVVAQHVRDLFLATTRYSGITPRKDSSLAVL